MSVQTPPSPAAAATRKPRIVFVASTVAYLWGIFLLVMMLLVAPTGMSAVTVVSLAIGLGYCVAGHLLRQRNRAGALLAFLCAAAFVLAMVLGGGFQVTTALLANVLVIALAGAAWPYLGPAKQE